MRCSLFHQDGLTDGIFATHGISCACPQSGVLNSFPFDPLGQNSETMALREIKNGRLAMVRPCIPNFNPSCSYHEVVSRCCTVPRSSGICAVHLHSTRSILP